MNENFYENPLWSILVETVHSLILYPHHKAYVRDMILHDQPEISSQELAITLGISFGEAMVILHELRGGNTEKITKTEE